MSADDGVIPVKVIRQRDNHYGVALGSEDDGTVAFEQYSYGNKTQYKNVFSEYWIDKLIADLRETKRYIAELKEKEN